MELIDLHIRAVRDGLSDTVLSVDEVRETGRAAFFFEYGEALAYADDQLYDLRSHVHERGALRAIPLPDEVLERGVGIEYGWRHERGCDCQRCAKAA